MNKVKNKLSEMQFFSVCHWCMANHEIKDQALALLRDEPNPNLWFAKDYLRKALNRWDVDGVYWVKEALKEIEKAESDEPCSGCGGSGEVRKEIAGMTDYVGAKIPCDCQPKEPTMHTPCAGESGGMYPRPTGSKPKDLAHFARAKEIMKTWPEWMREINYMPNTTNAPKEPKKAVEGYQENLDNQYKTIVTQREKIAELKEELGEWREKEGSVCPEDFGFVEYIKHLEAKNKQLTEQIAELQRRLRTKKEAE